MSELPVVAAVDGSEDSLRALDWAIEAARLRESVLRIVHVRQYAAWTQPEVLAAGPEQVGDPVLDRLRADLEGRGQQLPVLEFVTIEGAPDAVLPEMGGDAQLLVLGSRGRGGFASLLLGSNGMAAARDAACPVVVVPRPGRAVPEDVTTEVPAGPRVVVGLPVDLKDDSTLTFAFTEAARRGAAVHIVVAYPWPTLAWTAVGDYTPTVEDQEAAEAECLSLAKDHLDPHRAAHPGVETVISVAAGDAAGHLVAASSGAELVVVGRHRRRLLQPARILGSVTQAVLLHAAAPVAVVPLTAQDEAEAEAEAGTAA